MSVANDPGIPGDLWRQSKHIFVGETRLATKVRYEGAGAEAAERQVYYYHGDHPGSAQVVTNYEGKLYERYEYTPYGEVWIEWANTTLDGRYDRMASVYGEGTGQ